MLARQQDGAGHTYLKVLPPLILLSADVQLDSPLRSQSHQKTPVCWTSAAVSNNPYHPCAKSRSRYSVEKTPPSP